MQQSAHSATELTPFHFVPSVWMYGHLFQPHMLYISMAWSNNILLSVIGVLLKYKVHMRTCNHTKSFLRHTQTEREMLKKILHIKWWILKCLCSDTAVPMSTYSLHTVYIGHWTCPVSSTELSNNIPVWSKRLAACSIICIDIMGPCFMT